MVSHRRRSPLLQFKAERAWFRIADTTPPMEEISVTGRGRYKGRSFATLYTVKVRPTEEAADVIRGHGILFLGQGQGRATYAIAGRATGGPDFTEVVTGILRFGPRCTGGLKELSNLRTVFETRVDAKGASRTRVWRGTAGPLNASRRSGG